MKPTNVPIRKRTKLSLVQAKEHFQKAVHTGSAEIRSVVDEPKRSDTPTEVEPLAPEVLLGGGGASPAGYHQIESFLRCPKEYQFAHVRGLREPQATNPDYFSIGSLFHAGRARWFANKFDCSDASWDSIRDAVQAEALLQKLPVTIGAERKALALLQEFVGHWSKRPRPQPVAAEYLVGPVAIQEGDPFFLWRSARLDDLSRYPEAGGKLCIGESKTTSTSIADTVNQYTLHGQTLMQLATYNAAPNGRALYGPVAGIVLDVTKKPYGTEKAQFGRTFIPVSETALEWFIASMRHHLKQASQVDWDTPVPRNPSACTRQLGRMRAPCPFRDLCQHGKSASVKYVLRDGSSLRTFRPQKGMTVAPWD